MWRRWIYALRTRLRALVRPRQSDDELNDELSFHVAMQTQANVARGMTRLEAERQARLALGGVQQLKERLHDRRSVPWFDQLRHDVRYGVRTILRTKVVSAAIIVTFSLGIGANAAIFSLVNGVLLMPLPYSAPERIVAVEPYWTNTGRTTPTSSAPDFYDWHAQNVVLEFLAYHAGGEFTALVNGLPVFASVQIVTADFFNVFGASPVAGRVWTEQDRDAPVAVVSHAWALAHFAGLDSAVGKTIAVAGRSVEILGVMRTGFRYPGTTDIWVPSTMIPETPSRGAHNYTVVGRLKAGVGIEEARTEMRAIAARLEREHAGNRFKSVAVTPILDKLTSRTRTTLWLLLGVVAGVLLIACVNVAHLQLVRAAARTREMAVRCAMGAAPRRIMRQLLTESAVLGIGGCMLGLVVGWFTLEAFLVLAPPDLPRLDDVRLDGRVFGFTFAVTAVCSLLFGIGPARRAIRTDVVAGLQSHPGRGVLGGLSQRMRSTVVVAEVAISVVLLLAAGLLVRSFVQLNRVDLGFATERVLVTTLAFPVRGPDDVAPATTFYRDLVERVRALPGVRQTAGVRTIPFVEQRANSRYSFAGGPTYREGEAPLAQIQVITPGYFDTIRTSLRQGRDFTDEDQYGRPQVAIVNERLVRESLGGADPIGRVISTGMTKESMAGMRIVGVVADARQMSPETLPQPEIYLPYLQHPGPASRLSLVTDTSLDPDALVAAIRQEARRLNPEVPVRFSTMDDVFRAALSYPRFRTVLVAAFAFLAVTLAVIGIYSVLSYLVADRTREIGVRLAMGALRGDIFRRVIGGSMRLVLGGVAVGLLISFAAVGAIEAMLFDVSARDPWTVAGVIALLMVTAFAASGIPALRAASVDPLVALRDE
ncbi:MAG TPA: ABC transporter permease [Vicinamibacterales bacterium]|nr:ABC transporter permease [Vicinamibacterales bacterium]